MTFLILSLQKNKRDFEIPKSLLLCVLERIEAAVTVVNVI